MMKVKLEVQPRPLSETRVALKPIECGLHGTLVYDLPQRAAAAMKPGEIVEATIGLPDQYPEHEHKHHINLEWKRIYALAEKAREAIIEFKQSLRDPSQCYSWGPILESCIQALASFRTRLKNFEGRMASIEIYAAFEIAKSELQKIYHGDTDPDQKNRLGLPLGYIAEAEQLC